MLVKLGIAKSEQGEANLQPFIFFIERRREKEYTKIDDARSDTSAVSFFCEEKYIARVRSTKIGGS